MKRINQRRCIFYAFRDVPPITSRVACDRCSIATTIDSHKQIVKLLRCFCLIDSDPNEGTPSSLECAKFSSGSGRTIKAKHHRSGRCLISLMRVSFLQLSSFLFASFACYISNPLLMAKLLLEQQPFLLENDRVIPIVCHEMMFAKDAKGQTFLDRQPGKGPPFDHLASFFRSSLALSAPRQETSAVQSES